MRLGACGSWWAGYHLVARNVGFNMREVGRWREGRRGMAGLGTSDDFGMRKKRNTHVNQSCM